MRMILTMASLLIVSLLIFKGFAGGMGSNKDDGLAEGQQMTPVQKAENVNQLIEDAATQQRQQLEKQLQ